MAVSDKDFKKVQDDLKKVTDILFGIKDDPRFKAKIRKQVMDGRTDAGLPVIADDKGKRWSVNDVTELNQYEP